jgi:2-polyprenyl-3-methyl-5-hydroxy-6-metoxy-1,4-benzoquinol methylase
MNGHLGSVLYHGNMTLCSNCGATANTSSAVQNVRSIYSDNHKVGYTIMECDSCRHLFTHPVPNQDELDQIYRDSYAYELHAALFSELRQRAKLHAKLVAHQGPSNPILEIGCGSGILLEVLAGKGRRVAGLELSQKMIDIAKIRLEKFNQETNLFCGSVINDVQVPEYSHHDVILVHTLEHMLNPKTFLHDVANIMGKDNNLYIVVPNSRNVFGKPRNRWWGYWQVPIHVSHYSKESLTSLLTDSSFEIIEFKKFGSSLSARLLTFVNFLQLRVKRENSNSFKMFSFISHLWSYTYRYGTGELFVHARKI